MSITAIRTALATNLGTISGLRTAAEIPDLPNPPIAVVSLDSVTYDQAYAKRKGHDELHFHSYCHCRQVC